MLEEEPDGELEDELTTDDVDEVVAIEGEVPAFFEEIGFEISWVAEPTD